MRPEQAGRAAAALAVATALLAGPVAALDLNQATRAELERLDGIGVLTAERLLQERAKARFADWDDLQRRVKGMRGESARRLQRQGVTIGGPRAADATRKESQ